jgi:mRNA-degrading endonuclease RelE of RelBE toxin-antitoxin system
MLKRYEKFLEKLDKRFERYFEEQCEFIKCRPGCSACCEIGQYPFSRLELEYLMSGFVELPFGVKHKIKEEIKRLKKEKPKWYKSLCFFIKFIVFSIISLLISFSILA